MKVRTCAPLACAVALCGLSACAGLGSSPGSISLVAENRGLENFDRVGDVDWAYAEGSIQATRGGKDGGYLVSRQGYRDFTLHVEFWASEDANSGVFLRCKEPASITPSTCYEVNIFDQRPDPTYATGGIVDVARSPDPMPKAGGRWNTFDITARGTRLTVVMNGQTTVDVDNDKLDAGRLALQWARGTIRFRRIDLHPL